MQGKGGASVTLEPGGQFELSGAPLADLPGTAEETGSHLDQVPRHNTCGPTSNCCSHSGTHNLCHCQPARLLIAQAHCLGYREQSTHVCTLSGYWPSAICYQIPLRNKHAAVIER